MNRRFTIVLLALSLVLTGCSLLNGNTPNNSTASCAGPSKPELSAITVGGIAATSSAALYIAIQKGFFAQECLTVHPQITAGGAQAIPLVVTGQLQITLTNDVQAIDAQVRGLAANKGGIKIVADGISAKPGTFPLDVMPHAGINSIQDLAGKTVSVSSPSDIVTLALYRVLTANNMDRSKIHFVTIPFQNSGQVLASGQVDAAVQTDPYTVRSEKANGVLMLVDPFADPGPNARMPIASWVATGDFVQRFPLTVAAFQRAMIKAAQEADDNRASVEQVLPTYIANLGHKGESDDIASLVTLPRYELDLNRSRLQRVPDLMQHFGQLGPFDIASMFAT